MKSSLFSLIMVLKLAQANNNVNIENRKDLKEDFKLFDVNKDGYLNISELAELIQQHLKVEIRLAQLGNARLFFGLDRVHQNGQVEWQEWLDAFNNKVDNVAKMKNVDNVEHVELMLASAKAAWSESARSNTEALNIDEFLGFTHPLLNRATVLTQVEDLLANRDSNNDLSITQEELWQYYDMPKGSRQVELRAQVFTALDQDSSEDLDSRELAALFDPRNSPYKFVRAFDVIRDFDVDNDWKLGFDELKKANENGDLGLARALHDVL